MRKVLLIGLLFIVPTIIFAQGETRLTIDERLYDVFDTSFLERMQKETPAMLEYYNFFLDNVYTIQSLGENKVSDYLKITIDDIEDMNILKIITDYEIKRDYNNQIIYQIEDSDKLLILISEKELAKKFNKHTRRTH